MAQDPSAATETVESAGSLVGRRGLLLGGAAAVIGVPLLAACSGPSSQVQVSDADAQRGVVASTNDLTVGGGVINGEAKVVVTEPSKGVYKGFSAICTHAGCTVGQVTDGEIVCPCHGSKFSITDGSVTRGPAQAGLPTKDISVDGTDITLG